MASAVDDRREHYYFGAWGLYTFDRNATLIGMHPEGGAHYPIAVRPTWRQVVVGGWLVLMEADDDTPPESFITWPLSELDGLPTLRELEGITYANGAGFRAADVLCRPLDDGAGPLLRHRRKRRARSRPPRRHRYRLTRARAEDTRQQS